MRKKFLTNIANKLDFDLPTLDFNNSKPTHLNFVRFCLENLAFLEYERVDELQHILAAMDKTFSATGTGIAQIIECEVLHLRVDVGPDTAFNGTSETLRPDETPALDSNRLRQLAVAAQVCSLIWTSRMFIRDVWNMKKHLERPKNATKEINRAATRATNAPALTNEYLREVTEIMTANASPDAGRAICKSFAELMSTDKDVKVASDEEQSAEQENGHETPSEGTSRKSPSLLASGGGRGRKRKSNSANATPRKKGRPSTGRRKSASVKLDEDGDEDWE